MSRNTRGKVETPVTCECVGITELIKGIKEKLEECYEVISEQSNKMSEMQKEIKELKANMAENKLNNSNYASAYNKVPSYSQIVSNNKAAVIIKPIDENKNNADTKSELFQNINPSESNLQINTVANVRNGGIVVSCKNDTETKKFKDLAAQKLSQNYEIKEVANPRPRIKIAGISEKFDSESDIADLMKSQNGSIFGEDAECTVLRVWPTKRNTNIYQAIIQLDNVTYTKVMNSGDNYLFVGYDCCQVYDAVDLYRCYKCSGFDHAANTCQRKKACPVCSLEHELKDCTPGATKKCINCLHLKGNKSDNNDIDCAHAVWDPECRVYKHKLQRYKAKIFGRQ